jgi:dGTPase
VPATYASDPNQSRGRLVAETEAINRSPFQRDRDRIIHSNAFRRLKHKTQVFVYHEGDYYRTRLTHSIEVAQIARAISRMLGLNEDLAEALALAHDLGHTPFGHAGEEALAEMLADAGGFDHNAQTLRILTRLERRYAEFDGLNLTWETLEGVVKHNGPLTGPNAPLGADGRAKPVPGGILAYDERHPLDLDQYASAEAQVASLADDIAYNNHDFDDGLRAGLFDLDDVAELPLIGDLLREVRTKYPKLDRQRVIYETIRRMIGAMVYDLAAESGRRLKDSGAESAADIRALGRPVVAFSGGMLVDLNALRAFLKERMYRHFLVNRMASKARRIVTDLYCQFVEEPSILPTEWYEESGRGDPQKTRRVVADYIAGMTDRYALREHERIFDRHSQI